MNNKLKLTAFIMLAIAFFFSGCGGGSDSKDSNVPVTGVALNTAGTTILVGNTEQLTATVTPSGATNQNVVWTSDNESVATVSGGLVTAKAGGTAAITVTTANGGFTDTCAVTVPASGSLDAGFGTNGIVTTDFGASGTDLIRAVALQPDGKIVAAGCSYGVDADFAVARYNSNGTLDTTFDGDGIVTTSIGINDDFGYAVAIQSDGKIVVAGYLQNAALNYDIAVVRYNSDGSLDTTFDGDGKATTPVAGNDCAYAVAIQPDDQKIVVAGSSYTGASWDIVVIRYNTDGSLDTTFDGDGIVTTDIGGTADYGNAVTLQADGKIIVAGLANDSDSTVVRYNSSGSLDTTFDGDGIAITSLGIAYDCVQAVALNSDNKIIATGYSSSGATTDFTIIQYNSDGTPDTSFDGDGVVTTPVGSGEDFGYAVAMQSNNKIVVAGYSENITTLFDFAVARYNSDGTLDTFFDGDGIVTTDIGSDYNPVYAIAIQSDGRIVVAGYSDSALGDDFAVARYNP